MPADNIRLVLTALILEPLGFFLRCALAVGLGLGRRCDVLLLAHLEPPFHAITARCAASIVS